LLLQHGIDHLEEADITVLGEVVGVVITTLAKADKPAQKRAFQGRTVG